MNSHGEGFERQVAAIAAVVLNVLVAAFLLRMDGVGPNPGIEEDSVLRVEWIERRSEPPPLLPMDVAPQPVPDVPMAPTRRPGVPPPALPNPAIPSEMAVLPPERDPAATLSDDPWSHAARRRREGAGHGMFQRPVLGPGEPETPRARHVPKWARECADNPLQWFSIECQA